MYFIVFYVQVLVYSVFQLKVQVKGESWKLTQGHKENFTIKKINLEAWY